MARLFLDIETSGLDPIKHSILSLGIVVSFDGFENYHSFYEEIRYDELLITPEAIEINGIEFKSQKNRIPLEKASEDAFHFVKRYFSETDKPLAIGVNVGEFDLQFINKYMPKLAYILNRRSVNLNSLLYLLADLQSRDFTGLKQELSEKASSEVDQLNLGLKKHNALYDALFNLSLYSLIKENLKSNV
ncbi:MAG: hypothetical protein A2Y25_08310 [Candidatus Melainabacteria bacterium GWF2_37_15]|nr:MAG: hypothetical protein A2Y25_08310 [Candidatus Melainabacteria bacterium GWF2_37_15]